MSKLFGFGALPGLSTLKKAAPGLDVLMGVVVGLAGAAGMKYAINKLRGSGTNVPEFLDKAAPALGSAILGALAYALYRKKSSARATGWLVGAVTTGLAVTGQNLIRDAEFIPGDFKSYNDFGLLAADNSDMGLLAADNSDMSGLAEMAMLEEDYN